MAAILRLSPTKLLDYWDCPRKYYYRWVLGIKIQTVPANLVFGRIIADVVQRFYETSALQIAMDLPSLFSSLWGKAQSEEIIDYSSDQDSVSLHDTGVALIAQFPRVWAQSGLIVLLNEKGKTLSEQRLEIDLGGGVILSGRIDIAAMDSFTGETAIVDQKTPKTPTDKSFAMVSEQLTSYQLMGQYSGIQELSKINKLGFQDLVKRKISAKSKKGPEVMLPHLMPARTDRELKGYRNKVLSTAQDIRKGRFDRNPRMAHNTPCGMCDYQGHCYEGKKAGLLFPDDKKDLISAA